MKCENLSVRLASSLLPLIILTQNDFQLKGIHKIPEHNKKYILKCLWAVASNITAGKRMSFTTTLTTTTKYHGLQGDEVFQLLLWEGRGGQASVAPTDTLKYPELNLNLAKYWSCVPLHLRHWSLSDLWDHIISRTGGPSSLSLILHHPHCLKQPKLMTWSLLSS